MSDEDIFALNRGGHDPLKVYAAYKAAEKTKDRPTVILAKTVKGYGMGEAAEGKNIAHGVKKVDSDALRKFRDRFRIPFSDEELEKLPYLTFDEDSVEMKYMKARRAELHGFVPQRLKKFTKKLEIPSLAEFESITSKPIAVITNGYDVEKVVKKPLDEKFTLAHIGSLLSARNPIILWKALQELIAENRVFKEQFQLKLIGAVSAEVEESIAKFGLSNHLNYLGYLPHDEAIIEQRSSQVLLLIEIDSEETKCIVPGKLFEYMVSERPIIAIGPAKADFAQIIKETNTGTFFTYDELESLKAQIQLCFEQYQQNNLKVFSVGLQQYSRKALSEKLAKLLLTNH